MKEFFITYGISEWTFSYILLPLLIFLARILDVSINTLRIIFVMNGHKGISTLLGFFESLIWLLAIGQIFKNIDNPASYLAYPLGFASGIFIGMLIEEKLALGKVVVRVISSKNFDPVLPYLKINKIKFTIIEGVSSAGPEVILFSVVERDELNVFIDEIKKFHPNAFYTVESVKQARETGIMPENQSKRKAGSWIRSEKRK